MPLEIEVKIKVADHDAVRQRLRAQGATRIGLTLETNVFFDSKDKTLLNRDEGLRLRTNRSVDSGDETYVITHKGPRRPGDVKSREETEVKVDDRDETVRLFAALGFEKHLSFEKRRESWTLGGCKVELDEVPILGTFVEVEGPDEATIQKIRKDIELANVPMVKPSYIAMLTSYIREKGLPPTDIRFPANA